MSISYSPGFNTTLGRGAHFHFSNGWTASVQWGESNYCDRLSRPVDPRYGAHSTTAEIAAFPTNDSPSHPCRWYQFPDGHDIQGWQTPEQVAQFLVTISLLPPPDEYIASLPPISPDEY